MYAQEEKSKGNSSSANRRESRAVANPVAQKKQNGNLNIGFVDNRPEAAVQRKLDDIANSNSQANQLMAFQEFGNSSSQEKKSAQLYQGSRTRTHSIIQKAAIKDDEGENYHDSNYPGVKMARQEGGYPYKYAILNLGQFQGTIIVDDDGDYYRPDQDGYCDYDNPFNLQDVVLDDPETAANIGQIQIGQPGCGVVAGGGAVTLRTSGLNSCVAWLLYNEKAAYMEHILVGDPTKVKPDGISAQVAEIQAQFEQNVGSAATDLHIHVDESHPAYANSWPVWLGKLFPSGVTKHSSMGAGNYSHEVVVSESERNLWRCNKISLQYNE